MAWLVCEDRVLASAEVAESHAHRAKGLLGRDHVEGAFVLPRTRWIHTIGMRMPIDVAYLDGDGVVLRTLRMRPHRIGLPVLRARTVVEAETGAFRRWDLHVGDRLEVRP
jgi:uncharacterized membrane protein (UPF0127 family)